MGVRRPRTTYDGGRRRERKSGRKDGSAEQVDYLRIKREVK